MCDSKLFLNSEHSLLSNGIHRVWVRCQEKNHFSEQSGFTLDQASLATKVAGSLVEAGPLTNKGEPSHEKSN
jgi:hypothetical protein